MDPRPGEGRAGRLLARHWPDLLLALLAAGALLAARTPPGGALAALALLWAGAAAAVALAALVRRETSPDDPGARDVRLLALGLCGVHAAANFGAALLGADKPVNRYLELLQARCPQCRMKVNRARARQRKGSQ